LADADACSIRRKSRFIPATNFRVGIRSSGDFNLRLLRGDAMTLPDVNELYGTDERCRQLLERLRWPNGIECPRCKDTHISTLKAYARYECAACEYQFTATSGTIFHDSHLPLTKWFLAVLLLVEARKGMSANQLRRMLWGQHKGSYKTAWYLFHRIRAAMKEADRKMLDGTVEIDETWVGGRKRGLKAGEGKRQKEIVIGIRQRGGDVRFFHAQDVQSDTLYKFIHDNISEDVDVIVTDDFSAYPGAMGATFKDKHKSINHSSGVYVMGDVHTNTVESAFSLLKRGIVGTWHKISAKHLPAYLNEMQFRFNRRKRADLFLDTLRHMVTADPLTFEKLTA
jgi:transposase-like protein